MSRASENSQQVISVRYVFSHKGGCVMDVTWRMSMFMSIHSLILNCFVVWTKNVKGVLKEHRCTPRTVKFVSDFHEEAKEIILTHHYGFLALPVKMGIPLISQTLKNFRYALRKLKVLKNAIKRSEWEVKTLIITRLQLLISDCLPELWDMLGVLRMNTPLKELIHFHQHPFFWSGQTTEYSYLAHDEQEGHCIRCYNSAPKFSTIRSILSIIIHVINLPLVRMRHQVSFETAHAWSSGRGRKVAGADPLKCSSYLPLVPARVKIHQF